MYVQLGNDQAVESYRDNEGKLAFRDLPGQRVTELVFPASISVTEAFLTTLSAMTRHMKPGAKPAWVESDDTNLRRMLVEHYSLKTTKAKRPAKWGEDTGADKFVANSQHGGQKK